MLVGMSLLMVWFIIGLVLYFGLYVLVAIMAKNRNRNPVFWILLSIFGSPLLMCIILLALGYNYSNDSFC